RNRFAQRVIGDRRAADKTSGEKQSKFRLSQWITADRNCADRFARALQPIICAAQIGGSVRRVRILRQVQNLARVAEVSSPHRAEISRGVANRMSDKHLELQPTAERELEGGLQNRAQV